jgi:DNA-binding transcriptional ArsR family regulator
MGSAPGELSNFGHKRPEFWAFIFVLDIFLYGNVLFCDMARAATTSDVFNAIAEPRRREIIGLLAGGGEQAVGDLAGALRLAQPAVSKHLRVLRRVRLVAASRRGRRRVYRLEPGELKTVHDWIKDYERYWSHQISRIKERAEQRAREPKQPGSENSADPQHKERS